MKILGGGGGSPGGGGAEGPGGCLRRIGEFGGGGGLNIFFMGPNVLQVSKCILVSEFISAPAEGQQQQLKTTSDVTSKLPLVLSRFCIVKWKKRL